MSRARAAIPIVLLLVGSSPAGAGSSPPSTYAPSPSFLYVMSGGSELQAFGIDTASLRATPLPGATLPEGVFPRDLAIAPSGPFAYVATAFPNAVLGFSVSRSDGSLSALPGFPFLASGSGAIAAAVDGLGRFLYVGNNVSQDVGAYRIGASGQLSRVPGEPFPVTGVVGADALASDPAGAFLYVVTGAITAALSVYRIDPVTGDLAHVPGSPFPAQAGSNVVATDPLGRFVYVANKPTETLSVYVVDPSSGALRPVEGSPFPSGPRPLSLTVDTSGRFVLVGNAFDRVSAFSLDAATGALTAVPGSPFPSSHQPNSLFADPTGAALYVADPGIPLPPPRGRPGSVWAYRIDGTTGALTKAGEFSAGPSPWALAGLGPGPSNRPPDCSVARASRGRIWPPDHRLVPVNVLGVTDPDGGPVSLTIESIRQDEPVDAAGDGAKAPDGSGVGTPFARLRADRAGTGNGRVYHVGFSARDGGNESCSGVVRIAVPHDRGSEAVDDGALYDSTRP
jgi:6-phosphogluconolactonase